MQLSQMGIVSVPTQNGDAPKKKRQEATDKDNGKEVRVHKPLLRDKLDGEEKVVPVLVEKFALEMLVFLLC